MNHMTIMMVLLVCTLFSVNKLNAQNANAETIHFKNGSSITGSIIEKNANSSVKIKRYDGKIFSFPMEQVAKTTPVKSDECDNNPATSIQTAEKDRGYRGSVDLGGTIGLGDFGSNTISITTVHGYQFNPYLFIGAGIGFHYSTTFDETTIPIFADMKMNFVKERKTTPFFDMRLGVALMENDNSPTGIYANPSVGVKFRTKKNNGITLSLGYLLQMENGYGLGDLIPQSENVGGISLRLGYEF